MKSIQSLLFFFSTTVLLICHSHVRAQPGMFLQYQEYDTLRNNKLLHRYLLPFKAGEVNVGENTWHIAINQQSDSSSTSHLKKFQADITLRKGQSPPAAWGITFYITNWNKDNYLLMPGAVYQGNRFHSRKIPYSPYNRREYSPVSIRYDEATIATTCKKDRSGEAC